MKNTSLIRQILFSLLWLLPGALPLSALTARGHDLLQDWDYLRKPGQFMYIDDSGIHWNGSPINLYGPWKGVPMLCRFLDEIAQSDFQDDGSAVLTLRDMEDPRSIDTLLTAGLANEVAESARLLGRLKAEKAIPELIKLLYARDINIQIKTLEGLRLMGSGKAVPGMIQFGEQILPLVNESHFGTSGGSATMQGEAVLLSDLCQALGWIGDNQAVPFLRKVLRKPFSFDPTQTIRKCAAEGLAMLGDTASASTIAAIPGEYEAARILRLPVALQRAGELLTSTKTVHEDGLDLDARGAGIAVGLRIFAEMGSKKDIPFIKERMRNMEDLRIETITGGEPPFGYGNYLLNGKTIPVLFAWVLASLGDNEGFTLLDRYLASGDIVIAAEAARAFVIMQKTDRYPKIAEVFRREVGRLSYDGKEFEQKYGTYDYSFRARSDIFRMLAGQQKRDALRLLVLTHNDININLVYASRRALKAFPPDETISELVGQYTRAGDQEVFQLATMLEILGPRGMEALYKLATTEKDPRRRAVAMQAVIRYEYKDWRELITYAAKQNNAPMRELSEWIAYRFQRVEPDIVDKLRDPDFQLDEAEIPAEIKQAPAAFFKALNTRNYSRAWELLSAGSRDTILEFAGSRYLDIDYFTINSYFKANDQRVVKVWRSFFFRFDPESWGKNSFQFKKYTSDVAVLLAASPSGVDVQLLKEDDKWRFDLKDLARKLGIDLGDDSFLRQSILDDGRLEVGDAVMVNWDEELYQAVILEVSGRRYFVHYLGYEEDQDEWIEKSQVVYEY